MVYSDKRGGFSREGVLRAANRQLSAGNVTLLLRKHVDRFGLPFKNWILDSEAAGRLERLAGRSEVVKPGVRAPILR